MLRRLLILLFFGVGGLAIADSYSCATLCGKNPHNFISSKARQRWRCMAQAIEPESAHCIYIKKSGDFGSACDVQIFNDVVTQYNEFTWGSGLVNCPN